MTPSTLPARLLAFSAQWEREGNAPETVAILRESAAALSVRAPEGDMARALEWLRGFGWVVPDTVKSAIEEAIAAYDPERAGAFSGKLSGREAVVPTHEHVGRIIGAARKRIDNAHESHGEQWKIGGRTAINFIEERLHRAYPTTPPPGGGVVEANALSADELVELDKLVADVGPQHALNIFVELRAAIAGKVDEADRSIAELKRRTAAPSAKGG